MGKMIGNSRERRVPGFNPYPIFSHDSAPIILPTRPPSPPPRPRPRSKHANPRIFILCLVLLLLAKAVAGAEAGGGAAPVRPEGFSPKVSRDWRLIGPARVAEEGGRPIMAANRFSAGVLEAGALKDFTIAFRYRHANGIADIVLGPKGVGRLGPVYHVMLRSDAVVLARETPRGAQEPKTAAHAFQPGTWYDVSIQRGGGRFVVAVGGQPLLTAEEAESEPVDLVAFGSLAGEGFAFSDVKVTAGRGPLPAEAALRPGVRVYGTADAEALGGWRLASGSRFAPHGRQHLLEAGGGAEAVWSRATAADYTLVFSFQPGRGTALVALQRSGERGESSEYGLRLAADRVALSRLSRGEERQLASAPLRLLSDRWHVACVESLGGWKRVTIDHREVLKVEDPQPLPLGPQVFCSIGNDTVAYADIHLTPWTPKDAARIRGLLERARTQVQPPSAPPSVATRLPPQVVPLTTAVFEYGGPGSYKKNPTRIDPGLIPPNYVHTWILDLKDIETFRLHPQSPADIKLHPDDRITLYTLAGLKQKPPQPLVPTFTVSAKADAMTVDLSKAPFDPVPLGPGYRRVYLQLETSPAYVPRRFVLTGLLNTQANKGTEEAILLGDDLNYGDAFDESVIAQGVDNQGKPFPIPAPWLPGYHSNYHSYPPPNPKQGWFLIAENVTEPSRNFYTLAYYNEQTAALRLYLYNLDVPTKASGATVTLSLVRFAMKVVDGQPYPDNEHLKGAFFDLHPSADRWDAATVPLIQWGPDTWACIEVRLFYPMGENLPINKAKASPRPAHYYRSLYEDPLEPGLRSIRLELKVETFDYGKLDGSFVGDATGKAIEKLIPAGDPGLIEIAKLAGKAGGEIYKAGSDTYKEVKKTYDDATKPGAQQPTDTAGLKALGSIISMGSSVFSGGFGIAGAAISFIQSLFGGDARKPLELSIQLDLQGTLKGTFKVEHTLGPEFWRCYLPGRFPIQEVRQSGLLLDDPQIVASLAPRYDRTLGLFGYQYHPRELAFPLLADTHGKQITWMRMVYPTVAKPPDASTALWYNVDKLWCKTLEKLPPILYNPFAEIIPLKPVVVKTDTFAWGGPYWFDGGLDYQGKFYGDNLRYPTLMYTWSTDESWSTNVTPEPDDAKFPNWTLVSAGAKFEVRVFHSTPASKFMAPPEEGENVPSKCEIDPQGMVLQIVPEGRFVPGTYETFQDIKDPKVTAGYKLVLCALDKDKPGTFDPSDPFPLDNVIYGWDLVYFYYGRTRKANGVVPRSAGALVAYLRAPVSLDIQVAEWDDVQKKHVFTLHKAKSTLLQPPKE